MMSTTKVINTNWAECRDRQRGSRVTRQHRTDPETKEIVLNSQSRSGQWSIRSHVVHVATVLALVSGGLLGVSSAAAADPLAVADQTPDPKTSGPGELEFSLPVGFSSHRQFHEVQDRLRQVADRLRGATDDGQRSGFAGIELSVERRVVTLHWQGKLPSNIDGLVATQRVHAQVEVKPARYSRQQLMAVADRIVKDSTNKTGARVVRVAVPVDGHALEVGVENAAQQRLQLAASAGDVEVVVSDDKPAQTLYSRVADSPPFWGGARTINQNTGWGCSTGFAVNKDGFTAMLSAGHCGDIGDTFTNGDGSYSLGQVIEKSHTPDTMVILTSTAGRVYDGDAWGSSSRPVAGTAPNYVGGYMCTLGGYSGTRCDVVVQGVDEWIFTDVGWLGPLVRAEQAQYTNAAGEGDSGGPVISLTGPNWSQLMANGTITALGSDALTSCTGAQGRLCSWRIWYADINLALTRHNASIRLG
jgi:hypothetical protein